MTRPISAGLARRLAAGAAGFVGMQGDVYFVADYDVDENRPDPYLLEVYRTRAEAEAAKARRKTECDVFGPYSTPSPARSNPGQVAVEEFTVSAGPDLSARFPGGRFDALFCSVGAIQKFAMPYYASLYSPEFAGKVVDQFQSAQYALAGHLPWSEYSDVPLEVPTFLHLDANAKPVWMVLAPDGSMRPLPG